MPTKGELKTMTTAQYAKKQMQICELERAAKSEFYQICKKLCLFEDTVIWLIENGKEITDTANAAHYDRAKTIYKKYKYLFNK